MGLAYLLDPSFQIVDKSGNPVSNGYIEVYISGTSTKYYCYSDFNGSLHPFRIPLDALGSNIILANSESIYDVFIYNQFGTLVMSRHRVAPSTSTTTSGNVYILVEGTEGQIAVESSGSTQGDITYKVGLDDAIINELSGIHSDISTTSSYLDDKINNLDIHNISIAQSGDGNAYTSFTKNGDVYTFNKEATYLPSANAPVVLAGENVEVSSSNVNGKMQYTIKANPAGNVTNLISTDDSISISATSAGNDVTYDLSVKDIAGENGAKNYAFLKSEMPVNATMMALEYTDIHTNGIHWNTIDQRLEFGDNIKLIDLNYNLEYEISDANGVAYDDLILYIYSDGQLLDQETFTIDTSIAKHICKFNKKILDPSNLQFAVKVPKAGSIDASIDINDETFKSIAGGGGTSGATYSAGPNINITDYTISGKDWTAEINAKLDTTAFSLPNSAIWDNTYNTVNSNSAQWANDTTYTAGSNIDITDNVISGRDWTPELNTKLDTSSFTAFSSTTNEKIEYISGALSGTYELSAGSGIDITDYPNEQKTVISVTAQGEPDIKHDNTLSGNGTVNSPLSVVQGYNETLLWSGNSKSATLSESFDNFEKFVITYKYWTGQYETQTIFGWPGQPTYTEGWFDPKATFAAIFFTRLTTNAEHSVVSCDANKYWNPPNGVELLDALGSFEVIKVIGINRI